MKNEDAMQAQIDGLKKTVASLENELEHCLTPGEDVGANLTSQKMVMNLLIDVCAGIFRPETRWLESEKKWISYHRWYYWNRVPNVLLTNDTFGHYFADGDFREVFSLLLSAIESLNTAKRDENERPCDDAAEMLFATNSNDLHGLRQLRSAIKEIYSLEGQDRFDMEKEEIDYLVLSIEILIYCSEIYSATKPEEVKK